MKLKMTLLAAVVSSSAGIAVADVVGIGTQYTTFHASQWTPTSETPTPVYYGGTGYVGPASTDTYANYWVQLDLPNGALVETIFVDLYDNDANAHWSVNFIGYEAATWGVFAPFAQSFGSVAPADSLMPEYYTSTLVPDDTVVVRARTDFNNDGDSNSVAYVLTLGTTPKAAASMRFWGARVKWSRTISPPPATASFNDVPTDHWAFNQIEALADSGITAGCDASNFCPDATVTRAQMAVFLAKALGLHWPE
ncbi:hypothetical protein TBH_C2768 [Thiolapillus brandeum]|uniref:SLH domain-containing protein n=1 Tax=Thiolapillus brandeum TaxID=1076588 RepID=A0A7U6JIL7_9GAMM|nr:hypothetical protein TBH_C2768 [Thiolapillus brandeum]